MDYVAGLSLTFEQANLDYSHFYMEAVRQVGDEATGAILERVFREEIGHVKHGVTWFNRWRESPSHHQHFAEFLERNEIRREAQHRSPCAPIDLAFPEYFQPS